MAIATACPELGEGLGSSFGNTLEQAWQLVLSTSKKKVKLSPKLATNGHEGPHTCTFCNFIQQLCSQHNFIKEGLLAVMIEVRKLKGASPMLFPSSNEAGNQKKKNKF